MNTTLARIRVVLNAAPTWIAAVSTILVIVADEVAAVLPAGQAEVVGAAVVRIVAWLGAAVAIIRRVRPVLDDEKGLLPR